MSNLGMGATPRMVEEAHGEGLPVHCPTCGEEIEGEWWLDDVGWLFNPTLATVDFATYQHTYCEAEEKASRIPDEYRADAAKLYDALVAVRDALQGSKVIPAIEKQFHMLNLSLLRSEADDTLAAFEGGREDTPLWVLAERKKAVSK